MISKNKTKDPHLRGTDIILYTTISGIFILGITIVLLVFNYAVYNPSQAMEKGAWGDFIGGTLNPILTFLTLMGVLVSIAIQRMELSLSRQELRRSADALEGQLRSVDAQNFEAAFSQMLITFNSVTDSIDLVNLENGSTIKGKDCFRTFYTRFNKEFRENLKQGKGKHPATSTLRLSYKKFWKAHHHELGHYFRLLYNIFKFLDENEQTKTYHIKLLRAQLSDHELLLLFYNCINPNGKNFKELAVKYELFDNLPTINLLEDDHIELIDRKAFGQNSMLTSKNVRDAS